MNIDNLLLNFLQKYYNVLSVGDTPQNQGQCVGLIEVWTDSLGLPHTWGNAKDLLNDADQSKFEVIENTPTNYPVAGDIMVWGSSWGGGLGHTGVVLCANEYNFACFEQNNPVGSRPVINNHPNYSGILGWLHPKI